MTEGLGTKVKDIPAVTVRKILGIRLRTFCTLWAILSQIGEIEEETGLTSSSITSPRGAMLKQEKS